MCCELMHCHFRYPVACRIKNVKGWTLSLRQRLQGLGWSLSIMITTKHTECKSFQRYNKKLFTTPRSVLASDCKSLRVVSASISNTIQSLFHSFTLTARTALRKHEKGNHNMFASRLLELGNNMSPARRRHRSPAVECIHDRHSLCNPSGPTFKADH
jgi:hypothetical protein